MTGGQLVGECVVLAGCGILTGLAGSAFSKQWPQVLGISMVVIAILVGSQVMIFVSANQRIW